MEDLHAALKNLQHTLQKLLKNYTSLKKENEHLKKLNQEMHEILAEKINRLNNIEQKMTVGHIKSIYTDEEKKVLNSQIDQYLKDIQKCLDLLNT